MRTSSTIFSLSTKDAWEAFITNRSRVLPLYCQSAREVAAWAGRRDQVSGRAQELLRQVRNGAAFDEAFFR